MKQTNRIKGWAAFVAAMMLGLLMAGCASTPRKPEEDPLKYTKKLVVEGHKSLYESGAFQVPNTKIKLIPAGPSTMELAGELMGKRAKESFTDALSNAADSVEIVAQGTKLTYRTAGKVHEGTDKGVEAIQKMSRENSVLLIYRSSDLGKDIVGSSWDLSKRTMKSGGETGKKITQALRKAGNEIGDKGGDAGTGLASSSLDTAKSLSKGGTERAGKALSYAGSSFIVGYAAVPRKMKEHVSSMGDHVTDAGFSDIFKEENERRRELSKKVQGLLTDTIGDYGEDVGSTFEKAGKELTETCRTTGVPLAILKSFRWVVQGVLWDATVKPAAKITAASLGYLGVNCVAFPTLVVVRGATETTMLAVQVTWDATKMGYDIVAPTGTAAVAGVYGVVDFTGSNLAAGATAAGGTVIGYTGAAASKTAEVAVKGAGQAAGATVQYIGVPLASAGIAVGGGTIGTAVGVGGAAAAGTVFVTGETAAAGTYVFGNVISGATLVGGTAASAGTGAAYGVYEVSKAVVVPSGYELGGGIVLSYGTMTHLAAQSVLAASDCAYLVLSLEGPRWVIYAVKGKVSSGDDVASGAVVDLEKLRKAGEEIYYIPVSDEEMKKVVESMYQNLPETKETSVKETPAKETPAEKTPATDAPAKETPAKEAPAATVQ
jgi:hypothetical protein